MEKDLPLQDTRIICPPIPYPPAELSGTPRGALWQAAVEAYEASMDYSKVLGATMLHIDTQQEYDAAVANKPQTYVLFNTEFSQQHQSEVEEAFFAIVEGGAISRPSAASISELESDVLFEALAVKPFLLAYAAANRGEGKYLIEYPKQLESILRFCDAHEEADWRNALTIREYIETPGDYFTSYRILVTASGTILAGGLIYSGHSKLSHTIASANRIEERSISPPLQHKTVGVLHCLVPPK